MPLPVLNSLLVEQAVRAALDEDFGRAGDITSQATIPAEARAKAVIAARKKPGALAGLELAKKAFELVDPSLCFEALAADGDRFSPGAIVARIEGSARGILSAERVALNFLGRMCGVATLTSHYAQAVAHTKAKICCTRKTTPGLRAFEKYAVRCGGGMNHRFGLDDAVLIKDNHIAVAGGVIPALRAAKGFAGHLVKIEIEVDTLDQLREVLAEGADVVLLDNMSPEQLRAAVAMIGGRMLAEASGGVALDSVKAIAESGVDLISVGALTHSAPVLDLGLDIEMS
ncbi:nicotinate-nucleotide pyrophosphorylase [carboxylating] [Rhodoblastus acidophilus]|uniref:Probable nicotinate-nucleotide pyrophosphorylase [carboxylating] n=1 Tax=Rhodoblastus acidophilus TaxID=1074 RepID=A0A212S012_RHOAC|nr:carboxylating nicotinate-nucleotide diphosphorylase [Rhodoblastus acidophilus]MCW2316052.1 nicotinate-nucleotide pyrophosphorylase (carboxylating) [Rhodoblastus acidophilus]PPQ38269.1 nicotinate-nucleotide diphosphorylase (carboxylating) [Rhodoblastus acidophilus]RAI21796.1 nicotinate-nucleotide diphosphorylase (carboxylating) [Rhodoblastus acidophilus]SNB78497.1 nicotinate-nucleotide pyrophosphorylase [carboxylating] [Rhodoblastus acidophilus]